MVAQFVRACAGLYIPHQISHQQEIPANHHPFSAIMFFQ